MSIKLMKLGESKFTKTSMLIFGEAGVGKTSLVRTLPGEVSRRLYVAADPGQLAIRDLSDLNIFVPGQSGSLTALLDHVKTEGKKLYDWVIIDGLDAIGEMVLKRFKDEENKKDKPNLMRAYGDLADNIKPWIEGMRDTDVSTFFITHIDDDPEADIRYGPSFPGRKVASQLNAMFDEVLCMRMVRLDPSKPPERVMQTIRDVGPQYNVKDRSGVLAPFEKPDIGAIWNKIFTGISK